MKERIRFRTFTILTLALLAFVPLTSCGGGGAKAAKALQKVMESKSAKDVVKNIGRHGDDVLRQVSSTCTGYGQGNYNED